MPIEIIQNIGYTVYKDTDTGKTHREDGPALIYDNGPEYWYKQGVIHKDNGPAITWPNGNYEYRINGQLHREDGPAQSSGGYLYYYVKGVLHREDGPAIVYPEGGNSEYYLNGCKINVDIFNSLRLGKKSAAVLKVIEKFSDKHIKSKTPEKVGLALLQFLSGECQHLFTKKTKDGKVCFLCDDKSLIKEEIKSLLKV